MGSVVLEPVQVAVQPGREEVRICVVDLDAITDEGDRCRHFDCMLRGWSNQLRRGRCDVRMDDLELVAHHCRKRKYPTEVTHLFDWTKGLKYPDLKASQSIYRSVVGTYGACTGYVALAWDVVAEMDVLGFQLDSGLYRLLVGAFAAAGRPDLMHDLLLHMVDHWETPPPKSIVLGCMRALGRHPMKGITLINRIATLDYTGRPWKPEPVLMLSLLIQSSVVLGDLRTTAALADGLLKGNLGPALGYVRVPLQEPDLIMSFVMGATLKTELAVRFQYVQEWQDAGLLPTAPCLMSLILETAGFKCGAPPGVNRQSVPFREFVRSGTVKLLDTRRTWLRAVVDKLTHAGGPLESGGDAVAEQRGSLSPECLAALAETEAGAPDRLLLLHMTDSPYEAALPLILAQHVQTRLTIVKSTLARKCVQTQVKAAARALYCHRGASQTLDVILEAAGSIGALRLSGKAPARLAGALLDGLHVMPDLRPEAVLEYLESTHDVGITVFKEVVKAAGLLRTELSDVIKRRVAALALRSMHGDRGKNHNRKICQFLSSQGLVDVLESPQDVLETLAEMMCERSDETAVLLLVADRPRLQLELLRCLDRMGRPDLAIKYADRFELLGVPEVEEIVTKANERSQQGQLLEQWDAPTRVLTLTAESIIMVNDLASCLAARRAFDAQDVGMVGVDAEWRPQHHGGGRSARVELLQIALETGQVLIFDARALRWGCSTSVEPLDDSEEGSNEDDEVDGSNGLNGDNEDDRARRESLALVRDIFSSPAILKVGFAIDGDIRRLWRSFPTCRYALGTVQRVVDLSTLSLEARRMFNLECVVSYSLKSLVQSVLDVTLDKEMQRSDWGVRPLRDRQVWYAAVDAHVLPHTYLQLYAKGVHSGLVVYKELTEDVEGVQDCEKEEEE